MPPHHTPHQHNAPLPLANPNNVCTPLSMRSDRKFRRNLCVSHMRKLCAAPIQPVPYLVLTVVCVHADDFNCDALTSNHCTQQPPPRPYCISHCTCT